MGIVRNLDPYLCASDQDWKLRFPGVGDSQRKLPIYHLRGLGLTFTSNVDPGMPVWVYTV